MTKVTDILCDSTGDIACVGGDMVVGNGTYQHQADLLTANEGEYKETPLAGVGITGFLNDENPAELQRKIRIQFTKDGMSVVKVAYGTNLEINANY
ncbi:MAG: hypothetical protein WCO44_12375 [Bacteroidota bacterium]